MTGKNTLLNALVIAALATGAAIPASAQKRHPSPTQRKQTTQPAATTATSAQAAGASPVSDEATAGEPAKKNTRSADESGSRPSAGQSADPASNSANAAKKNADAAKSADAPRYFYEFTQPEFDVPRVRIEHDAAGRGTITFERRNEEQPVTEPLEISPTAFARIASAWGALRFLDSQESYQSDKHFANLGVIRLTMRQGGRERTAQFDWTNNEQAAALRREYQRLSEQQLFVFDMEVARQYQPSETVRLLKLLESLLNRDELSDRSLVAPLLADLSNDERVPLIARNQAARLLKRIEKEKK
jgi:hypothetical protein